MPFLAISYEFVSNLIDEVVTSISEGAGASYSLRPFEGGHPVILGGVSCAWVVLSNFGSILLVYRDPSSAQEAAQRRLNNRYAHPLVAA